MDGNCPKCKSVFDVWCIIWNYECNIEDLIKALVFIVVLGTIFYLTVRKCVLCRIFKWCLKSKKPKDDEIEESDEKP